MRCLACGRDNPDAAGRCEFCSAQLGARPGAGRGSDPSCGDGSSAPRISRLAVASLVLGALALTLGLVSRLAYHYHGEGQDYYASFYLLLVLMPFGLVVAPTAVVLGVVALVQISQQPERLAGRAVAVLGIILGALSLLGGGATMAPLVVLRVALVGGAVALIIWLGIRRARPAEAEPEREAETARVPVEVAERPPLSGLAVASGVLTLLVFATCGVTAVPAIIIGLIALIHMRLRRGVLRGQWLALASILVSGGLLAVFASPVLLKERVSWQKRVCLSNVKHLALALQMYLEDNDGAFPPSANWCEQVEAYTHDAPVFRCPAAEDGDLECAFAYNASLSGVLSAELADPGATVAVFESDEGWNAAGGRKLLAGEPRHFDGDNLGFADGHAAWWSRQRLLSREEPACRWEPH